MILKLSLFSEGYQEFLFPPPISTPCPTVTSSHPPKTAQTSSLYYAPYSVYGISARSKRKQLFLLSTASLSFAVTIRQPFLLRKKKLKKEPVFIPTKNRILKIGRNQVPADTEDALIYKKKKK